MGFKLKLIDNCKKIDCSFLHFENDPFFEHLHSKFAENFNMTPIFFQLNCTGYQKTQNFMLIPNSLKWTQKKVSKKVLGKHIGESAKKCKFCIAFF
jgi:hypothetical protein